MPQSGLLTAMARLAMPPTNQAPLTPYSRDARCRARFCFHSDRSEGTIWLRFSARRRLDVVMEATAHGSADTFAKACCMCLGCSFRSPNRKIT